LLLTRYLRWKTDDNNVGLKTTRLWGQELAIAPGNVKQLGNRTELMDSSGLWWVESWVSGGSLAEGPELIFRGGYYYLFFAAGKYCQDSYSEGVARSKSIWGPYEKMPVPLLSTGLTGNTGGQKQVGPGHASFLTVGQRYFAVYHASPGENCNRHAFVEEMKFDEASGWPYVDFGSKAAASYEFAAAE
jgi:arabinan endo-1,5-alpha-L-arabinosidase